VAPLKDARDGRASTCREPRSRTAHWEALASGQPVAASVGGSAEAQAEALVLALVRELTGRGEVTPSTPLMEAGVDSLAATELSNRLQADTGLRLSPTLVFEQPTPRAIAAHVLKKLHDEEGATSIGTSSDVGTSHNYGELRSDAYSPTAGEAPVVLTSVAGRWAGGCDSGGALWTALWAAADAIGGVPAARWALESVVDVTRLSEAQEACVRHGGFVCDVEGFDNVAFGISPAECSAK
jgi:acyl carrier protein